MPTVSTACIGGLINTPVSQMLQDNVGTLTWEVVAGSLPPGLTLDEPTGVVSGNCVVEFDNYVRIRVTDAFAATDEADVLARVTNKQINPIDRTGDLDDTTIQFLLDGVIWQFAVVDQSGPVWVLGAYKSTDNGVTWWRKGWDHAEFPQTATQTERRAYGITWVASAAKFYVVYPDAGFLKVATFDPATAEWDQRPSAGGPSCAPGFSGDAHTRRVVMTSTGVLHVFYRKNDASLFDDQLYVSTWSEAGGWNVIDKLISTTSQHPSAEIFRVTNALNNSPFEAVAAIEADGVLQVLYSEEVSYFAAPTSQDMLHWRTLSLDGATLGADYIQPETDHARTNTPYVQGAGNYPTQILIGDKIYMGFKCNPQGPSAPTGSGGAPSVAIVDITAGTITSDIDMLDPVPNDWSDAPALFIGDPAHAGRLYAMYYNYGNFFGDILFLQYNDLLGAGWVPSTAIYSSGTGQFCPLKAIVYFNWAHSWPGELMDGANGNDPVQFAPIAYDPRPLFLGDGRIACAISTEDDLNGFDRLFIVPQDTASGGSATAEGCLYVAP